ncbi:MAG TPA: hypothetical protein PLQ13_05790 [Candidatus Krumholzibacteria bacterium]|nr:hypothetical protein [Candidatus Krumholzibacteria bacterium]
MSDSRVCRLIQDDPHGESWGPDEHAHLAVCPGCAAHVEVVAALGARIAALPRFAGGMPGALRGRLLELVAACPDAPTVPDNVVVMPGTARGRRPDWTRRIAMPVAMAAVLVCGIFLGRDLAGPGVDPADPRRTIGNYISDVTHDHYLLEELGRPLEIASTDREQLSGWLSRSLSFGVDLPPADGTFALEGGRVWHTVGRLSAMASYVTPDGSRAILFAVPATDLDLAGAPSSMIHGVRVFRGTGWDHEARAWIDGDLAMALVAPTGHLPESWPEVFLH